MVCLCLCHLSLSQSSAEICIFALDDVEVEPGLQVARCPVPAASCKLQVAAVADIPASNRHLSLALEFGVSGCLRAARKL